jgi:uroporphyrinogen-III synthase
MSARKTLPEGLIEMGAEVIVAKAYESNSPHDKTNIKKLIKEIKNYEIDAITFTSPLTAHNLIKELDDSEKIEVIEKLKSDKIYVASIGPITYKALKEHGIESLFPKKYTVKDMLDNLFNEMNSI